MIQFIFTDLSTQRVAVDSQHDCSTGLVSFGTFQYPLDESFLKFSDGFVEQNAPFDHLNDKTFQLISHVATLQIQSVIK